MPLLRIPQHSFGGGILDARLQVRSDLQKYFVGAADIFNLTVKRQGALEKRQGTALINRLTDSLPDIDFTGARLIPFIYDQSGGFVLIFTDLECRAFSQDGTFVQTIITPFTETTLSGVNYCQSGDTLFLASKKHKPSKIVRNADNTFSWSEIDFYATPVDSRELPLITAIDKANLVTSSGRPRTIRYIATEIANGKESLGSPAAMVSIPTFPWGTGGYLTLFLKHADPEADSFNLYRNDGFGFGYIGNTRYSSGQSVPLSYFKIGTEAGVLTNTTNTLARNKQDTAVVTVNTINTNLQQKNFLQGFKIAKQTANNNGGIVMQMYNDSTTLVNSTATEATTAKIDKIRLFIGCHCTAFDPNETAPSSSHLFRVSACKKYSIQGRKSVTATDAWTTLGTADFSASSDRMQRVYTPDMTIEATYRSDLGPAQGFYGLVAYFGLSVGVTGPEYTYDQFKMIPPYVDIDITVPDLYWQYRVIAEDTETFWISGIELFSSEMESTNGEKFVDQYFDPNLTQTLPIIKDVFNSEGNYPGFVSLYQQRLVFASSENEPYKFWMSCVGDLYNFSESEILTESDAIEAQIPVTEGPKINAVLTMRDIHLFAESSEWILRPYTGNALSYKTLSAEMQSVYGSSDLVRPLIIGRTILFLEASRKTIRELKQDFSSSDGYEANDISVICESVFKNNPIVDWAYQQFPDSIIWMVLEDGTLASLTYMPQHEVIALARHTLDGITVKAICASKSVEDESSNITLLAQDGTEFLLLKLKTETANGKRFSLDLSMTAKPADTPDLANRTVIDSTGAIVADHDTLDADTAYLSGYPFASELLTVRPEAQQQTLQAIKKKVLSVDVRMDRTDSDVTIANSSEAEPDQQLVAVPFKNGGGPETATVTLQSSYNYDSRVRVRHEGIRPITLLSLIFNIEQL